MLRKKITISYLNNFSNNNLYLPNSLQSKREPQFKQHVWKPVNIININTSEVFYRLWKGHDKNSFVFKLDALA